MKQFAVKVATRRTATGKTWNYPETYSRWPLRADAEERAGILVDFAGRLGVDVKITVDEVTG